MPMRFAANLGFLWPQFPLLERIDAAAQAGFRAVEFHWPYEVPADEVAARCRDVNVRILGVNTSRGEASKGEFGLAALPGKQSQFRDSFAHTVAYANACGATAIHVLAGVTQFDTSSRTAMIENLNYAASLAAAYPLTLLLEPLNPHDNPGYFYSTVAQAVSVISELARPNIKLQFDAYHVARVGGDVLALLREHVGRIGHIQIAGVPHRHEPEEFEYRVFFTALERLNYAGYIGCEYRPRGDTDAGLAWMKTLGVR